ncbi:MAG: methyltransferase [Vicinamibacterales bacterium]
MTPPDAETLPPHVQLIQMSMGHWVSWMLFVAAEMGLADRLADGPRRADEIAGAADADPVLLHRFMRTLSGLGILAADGDGAFRLTPLGAALRSGAPGSARASILTTGSPWWRRGFEQLHYSLRTGKSGFEKAMGMPIFDWLAQHPDQMSLFNETMIGIHGGEPPAVVAAYDFSGVKTLVDVGGGTGNLLTTIVAANPGLTGILFDQPHVVREAGALIEARGVAGRVRTEAGSFFEHVPAGADAYLLSHIIHDWTEPLCLRILGHCRDAVTAGGRVLIVEMVLPDGDEPHPGKLLDMMMLVGPGGQERTVDEYAALLAKAGLRLSRVVPTASPVSVVEAVVA